jgi:hypothetical protein
MTYPKVTKSLGMPYLANSRLSPLWIREMAVDSVQEPSIPIALENRYAGISGWLAFFALGVFINPIYIGINLKDIIGSFSNYTLIFQTALVPRLAITGDSLLVIFSIAGAYLFFRKRRITKKLYIWLFLLNAIFTVFIVNAQLMDMNNAVKSGAITQKFADDWLTSAGPVAGRALLVAFIWVPYLIRSKRVKATFVN